jgi:hypothetical protein
MSDVGHLPKGGDQRIRKSRQADRQHHRCEDIRDVSGSSIHLHRVLLFFLKHISSIHGIEAVRGAILQRLGVPNLRDRRGARDYR